MCFPLLFVYSFTKIQIFEKINTRFKGRTKLKIRNIFLQNFDRKLKSLLKLFSFNKLIL